MIRFDEITQLAVAGPIGALYAALGQGPAGEAIVGVPVDEGWQPLICSDKGASLGHLDELLGLCQRIADETGLVIRVVRYERAGLVGEFRPGGPT